MQKILPESNPHLHGNSVNMQTGVQINLNGGHDSEQCNNQRLSGNRLSLKDKQQPHVSNTSSMYTYPTFL
jgi:hypothetical protein